jgi:hypothetical protein
LLWRFLKTLERLLGHSNAERWNDGNNEKIMNINAKLIWIWLFSLYPSYGNEYSNETDRLEATMKTTAINRYNASSRLNWQGKIAFITTIILSLEIIFIPLMQMAKIPLLFKDEVLAAIQIFFAVSILVYSVVIGTARYDVRSEKLNDCGDKIKDLIRELRRQKEFNENEQLNKEELCILQDKYSAIATDVENHTINDYRLTTLNRSDMFKITGIKRLYMWCLYFLFYILPHTPSILLLLAEGLFISDMFGITNFFTPFLNGRNC